VAAWKVQNKTVEVLRVMWGPTAATLILCTCIAACGSRPLSITAIQLGRSLNPDRSVAEFDTVFAAGDTIYVSVLTAGGGSGTIAVRWTYRGKVIGEPTKRVEGKDFAATDFPLQSAGGFPFGSYEAEILLDGKSVGTKTFRVEPGR
jgi:hypothetical protein